MSDTTRPTFPVRPPAPGPVVVLDLVKLWAAVQQEMDARGWTEQKQVSEVTGIDRNTLGRIRRRALAGEQVHGQRGGINVNAVLTLITFVGGQLADFGRWERPAPSIINEVPIRDTPFGQ